MHDKSDSVLVTLKRYWDSAQLALVLGLILFAFLIGLWQFLSYIDNQEKAAEESYKAYQEKFALSSEVIETPLGDPLQVKSTPIVYGGYRLYGMSYQIRFLVGETRQELFVDLEPAPAEKLGTPPTSVWGDVNLEKLCAIPYTLHILEGSKGKIRYCTSLTSQALEQ